MIILCNKMSIKSVSTGTWQVDINRIDIPVVASVNKPYPFIYLELISKFYNISKLVLITT